MGAWLAATWAQVWPNLAADLLWATPAFLVHHRLIRRHINAVHQDLKEGQQP